MNKLPTVQELVIWLCIGIAGVVALVAGDAIARVIGGLLLIAWLFYMISIFPS